MFIGRFICGAAMRIKNIQPITTETERQKDRMTERKRIYQTKKSIQHHQSMRTHNPSGRNRNTNYFPPLPPSPPPTPLPPGRIARRPSFFPPSLSTDCHKSPATVECGCGLGEGGGETQLIGGLMTSLSWRHGIHPINLTPSVFPVGGIQTHHI